MRLIDADALLKLVDSDAPAITEHMMVAKAWVMAILQSRKLAPTVDAVPVVRCKDCKYYKVEDGQCPADNTGDRYYSWVPDPDWFCADGEEKDDDK